MELARGLGLTVAYDPNYRASLWPDEATAKEGMRSLVPLCDVMKLSDEETELLTGEAAPEAATEKLLEQGVSCVVVTLGGDGAMVATKEGSRRVASFPTRAVDTTGAGDAFWGAFLTQLTRNDKVPENLTLDEAARYARFANAAASLCVGRRGLVVQHHRGRYALPVPCGSEPGAAAQE